MDSLRHERSITYPGKDLIAFLFLQPTSLLHFVMGDNLVLGHTWHVSRDSLGHLAVMDVMESKETWAARERLDTREHLVRKERKEQRENLGSRVLQAKKDREGTKVTVELLGFLHT